MLFYFPFCGSRASYAGTVLQRVFGAVLVPARAHTYAATGSGAWTFIVRV